ncbi:hypothetical protein PCE1_001749 [Barthelona sp. PCE]
MLSTGAIKVLKTPLRHPSTRCGSRNAFLNLSYQKRISVLYLLSGLGPKDIILPSGLSSIVDVDTLYIDMEGMVSGLAHKHKLDLSDIPYADHETTQIQHTILSSFKLQSPEATQEALSPFCIEKQELMDSPCIDVENSMLEVENPRKSEFIKRDLLVCGFQHLWLTMMPVGKDEAKIESLSQVRVMFSISHLKFGFMSLVFDKMRGEFDAFNAKTLIQLLICIVDSSSPNTSIQWWTKPLLLMIRSCIDAVTGVIPNISEIEDGLRLIEECISFNGLTLNEKFREQFLRLFPEDMAVPRSLIDDMFHAFYMSCFSKDSSPINEMLLALVEDHTDSFLGETTVHRINELKLSCVLDFVLVNPCDAMVHFACDMAESINLKEIRNCGSRNIIREWVTSQLVEFRSYDKPVAVWGMCLQLLKDVIDDDFELVMEAKYQAQILSNSEFEDVDPFQQLENVARAFMRDVDVANELLNNDRGKRILFLLKKAWVTIINKYFNSFIDASIGIDDRLFALYPHNVKSMNAYLPEELAIDITEVFDSVIERKLVSEVGELSAKMKIIVKDDSPVPSASYTSTYTQFQRFFNSRVSPFFDPSYDVSISHHMLVTLTYYMQNCAMVITAHYKPENLKPTALLNLSVSPHPFMPHPVIQRMHEIGCMGGTPAIQTQVSTITTEELILKINTLTELRNYFITAFGKVYDFAMRHEMADIAMQISRINLSVQDKVTNAIKQLISFAACSFVHHDFRFQLQPLYIPDLGNGIFMDGVFEDMCELHSRTFQNIYHLHLREINGATLEWLLYFIKHKILGDIQVKHTPDFISVPIEDIHNICKEFKTMSNPDRCAELEKQYTMEIGRVLNVQTDDLLHSLEQQRKKRLDMTFEEQLRALCVLHHRQFDEKITKKFNLYLKELNMR